MAESENCSKSWVNWFVFTTQLFGSLFFALSRFVPCVCPCIWDDGNGMDLRLRGWSESTEYSNFFCPCRTVLAIWWITVFSSFWRDIKAGNILLNAEGHAKLADFGVAGQLTVSKIFNRLPWRKESDLLCVSASVWPESIFRVRSQSQFRA